jgi:hypothetical protein
MSPSYFTFVLLICLVMLSPALATAQNAPQPDRTGALRVFLDCAQCDEDYLRTEITFINYVRDRADADVHVLVTTQETGGGGQEFTIKFIGLGRFAGVDHTLPFVSLQTDTEDQRRAGFAAVFRLGLIRYAAETPLAPRLKVTFDAPKDASSATAVSDPWNFWVFRIGASGALEGEESGSENQFSVSLSANRTTEAWKLNFEAEGEYGEEEFVLDEGEIFTSVSRTIEADALVGKSVTDHWSLGGVTALESSIFSNYDLRTRVAGAVEYNIFPYSQSTRRLLALLYTIGVEAADYIEVTIYDKTSETLPDHRFETTLELRQPWGSASASFEAAQYLSRPDKYRLSTFGGVELRLFKGLSIELFGEAARRRDQLSLRRGDATNEEILVRQRELATGYEYELTFGITYSFGSIFNNVVNPRFRNAGGF